MRTYNRDERGRFAKKNVSASESFADMLDAYDKASGGEQVIQGQQKAHSKANLRRINAVIDPLIKNGDFPDVGVACNPVPRRLNDYDPHGMERLKDRGITLEDAQNYIDYAVIMFEQDGGMLLYLSEDGGAVLVDATGNLMTAYPKGEFKKHTKKILKVVLENENK